MDVSKVEVEQREMELRSRLLNQTTRVIRRRRYSRRVGIAAACAGCYLAGLLTEWGMSGKIAAEPLPQPIAAQSRESKIELKTEPHAAPAPELQKTQKQAVANLTRPPRKPKSKFEQLRELGDYYMLDQQDLAGATRCYQMALRYASDNDLNQSSEEGTWLFRALKLDHQGEIEHAKDQG